MLRQNRYILGVVGLFVVSLGLGISVWTNRVEAMGHNTSTSASVGNAANPIITSLAVASKSVTFPVHAPQAVPSTAVLEHVALVPIGSTGMRMVEIDYGLPTGTLDIWEGPSTMSVTSPNEQAITIDGLKAQSSQWNAGTTSLYSLSVWTGQAMYEVVGMNEPHAQVRAILKGLIN